MKTLSEREVSVKKVLKTLKQKGLVTWQGDDSPQAYKVVRKVLKKCKKGVVVLHWTGDGWKSLAQCSGMAGRFIAFYN